MQRPPFPLPARQPRHLSLLASLKAAIPPDCAPTAKSGARDASRQPQFQYCTGAVDFLGSDAANRRFWPIADSLPATARRMACVDFSAFDDQPAVVPRLRDANNAEFWEAVANRELTILRAAKILAKQLHSDVGVPSTLGQALAAMEAGITKSVELAILAHEDNKGTNGQKLRKLLRAPL